MSQTEPLSTEKLHVSPKNKVSLTGMTLFSLGIMVGFLGGWLVGRQATKQPLIPVPIEEPGPDIFIPYASPSPQTVMPTEPGTIEPWPMPIEDPGIACTMDALQCPDGSSVGRQGPNCEFAPCPESSSGKKKPSTGNGSSGSAGSAASPVMDAPVSTVAPQAQ